MEFAMGTFGAESNRMTNDASRGDLPQGSQLRK